MHHVFFYDTVINNVTFPPVFYLQNKAWMWPIHKLPDTDIIEDQIKKTSLRWPPVNQTKNAILRKSATNHAAPLPRRQMQTSLF